MQTTAAQKNITISAPCAYQAYRDTRFFTSLDGLRCLSILAVIWHHTAPPIAGLRLAQTGHLGVDLFFAISGFLITTLLLREQQAWGKISLQAFYVRRSLRIFPLYYTVIAIYIFVVLSREANTLTGRAFFENLPYFLTYTSNWFVLLDGRVIFYFAWSLATEEQFYLVWPTIEKCLGGWRASAFAVALLLVRGLTSVAVASGWLAADQLWVVILLSIHPAILGGVLLAHTLHNQRTFEAVQSVLGMQWAAPIILVGLVASVEFALPMACIWVLMVFLVGSVVICESNALAKLLRWKPIAHIGVVSYGMYLMHMLSYNLVKHLMVTTGLEYKWLWFPATAAITTFAATISYRYYESWFLQFKYRFTRLETKPLVSNSPSQNSGMR